MGLTPKDIRRGTIDRKKKPQLKTGVFSFGNKFLTIPYLDR
jgi:hypothetical protein